MHLVGAGRVNLANYSTCLHRLARVVVLPMRPGSRDDSDAMAAGWSRAEEGQRAVIPAICAADVPTVEMACRVDLGKSVLEGSNIKENWATNFGGVVGGGGGNKAGEVEDVLDAITSGGGGSGSIMSTQGGRQ